MATRFLIETLVVGPLSCNMTIIACAETKKAVLIDPGGNTEDVLQLIKQMGVKVEAIFITHGHFDHCLAAEEVKQATGALVHVGELDEQLWQAMPLQLSMFGVPPVHIPKNPDVFVKEGHKMPLGGVAIHTPGHSPGSMCYYFKDAGIVFTGDTLFQGSIGRTDFLGGSLSDLVTSIRTKLFRLPGNTRVISGHGPETTIHHEKASNPFVGDSAILKASL